jgi:hypothetical protein
MNPPENSVAFGAPGIEPRWTSSAKEGVGTAYHTRCRLWFTLSHGIINEIYYPQVDQPNTRDLQFLISDGETFCHEERRDTNQSDTTLESELNLSFADFPTAEWPAGSVFEFTCFWKRDQRWQDRNWQVSVL